MGRAQGWGTTALLLVHNMSWRKKIVDLERNSNSLNKFVVLTVNINFLIVLSIIIFKLSRWLDFVLVTFCPSLYCGPKYSDGFVQNCQYY